MKADWEFLPCAQRSIGNDIASNIAGNDDTWCSLKRVHWKYQKRAVKYLEMESPQRKVVRAVEVNCTPLSNNIIKRLLYALKRQIDNFNC